MKGHVMAAGYGLFCLAVSLAGVAAEWLRRWTK